MLACPVTLTLALIALGRWVYRKLRSRPALTATQVGALLECLKTASDMESMPDPLDVPLPATVDEWDLCLDCFHATCPGTCDLDLIPDLPSWFCPICGEATCLGSHMDLSLVGEYFQVYEDIPLEAPPLAHLETAILPPVPIVDLPPVPTVETLVLWGWPESSDSLVCPFAREGR